MPHSKAMSAHSQPKIRTDPLITAAAVPAIATMLLESVPAVHRYPATPRMRRSLSRALIVLILGVILLPGCATTSSRRYRSDLRKVLDQGVSMLGKEKVRVGRTPFRSDCSGFVSACYSTIGTDLADPTISGHSGTEIIYKSLKKAKRVHNKRRPRAGDLAFFHNTHDRNGNGIRDDRFTHIALVERVDEDGTVYLLHFVSGKVRRDRLNRLHRTVIRDPGSGKEWNSHLRRGGGKTLTAQLLYRFGTPISRRDRR